MTCQMPQPARAPVYLLSTTCCWCFSSFLSASCPFSWRTGDSSWQTSNPAFTAHQPTLWHLRLPVSHADQKQLLNPESISHGNWSSKSSNLSREMSFQLKELLAATNDQCVETRHGDNGWLSSRISIGFHVCLRSFQLDALKCSKFTGNIVQVTLASFSMQSAAF